MSDLLERELRRGPEGGRSGDAARQLVDRALLRAIVNSQARRFESGRKRGYARRAATNVSWKQSSAAPGPADATRKRRTASAWASIRTWNGGSATAT